MREKDFGGAPSDQSSSSGKPSVGEMACAAYERDLAANPNLRNEFYALAKEMGKSNTEGDEPPPE